MKIVWTEEAEKSYLKTIEFILSKWTVDVAENFETELNCTLNFISSNPNLFILSKKKGFCKAIISEQTSLIYKVSDEQISLITFVDNRF